MNFFKKKITIITSILVVIFFVILYFVNSMSHSDLNDLDILEENTLRIVAANLNYANYNLEETTDKLFQINADILIILEYTGSNIDLEYFENNGYRIVLAWPISSPHGICAIVKNKINANGKLIKIPYKSPCQMPFTTIRFKIGNKFISVWGVHTPPPVPSCLFKTSATIRNLATYVENGTVTNKLGISEKGDYLIMAGDFNLFWFHPAIFELKNKGLVDGYSKHNFFPAMTWAPFSWLPQFIGLDYIFCSNQLDVINSYIMKINGSDHSCVITDIKVE